MAGEPIGLLLVLTGDSGGGGPTPVASGTVMAIVIPDETATGAACRIWAEAADNTGNIVLDANPQITIWSLDDNGSRTTNVATTTMTSSAGEAFYYDWTPADSGEYIVQVAGEVSAASVFNAVAVSVRSKFDPIALALHDVLAARM